MSVTAELTTLIQTALATLQLSHAPTIQLEHPANADHGEYSTNVALKLFGELQSDAETSFASPRELASAIAEAMTASVTAQPSRVVAKVTVAGPGFINFYLSDEYYHQVLTQVLTKGATYGRDQQFNGQKVMVEYTDPNPFKEFHIGHLYSNIVGESIARLHEAAGANVWRADFFGDVGMHVAKSIWGLLASFADDGLSMADLAHQPLSNRIQYLGAAYARGATAYEENDTAKEEMKALNFLIFKAAQEVVLPRYKETPEINFDQFITPSKYSYEEIRDIYHQGREWSLAYFETIYQRLGTKFDGYYPESVTGEYGYGMVMEGLEKGYFERGDGGAIIFPGEKHGLHNRVFINALGLPTYETKDFGNAVAKYQEFAYDKSIIVTGNEINEYFVVVLKALRLLRPDLGDKTYHIGHGMVRLPEGKMSSRTGKILRGEWLLDEAKTTAVKILADNTVLTAAEKEDVAEKVALAAVKYALLKQNIGENIAFDFEKSVNFSGNSGPYLQYTSARAKSVVRKAGSTDQTSVTMPADLTTDDSAVLKWLARYPEVVAQAASEFAPHLICTYLYELAQRFNAFYNNQPILGLGREKVDAETQQFRIALTAATAQVIHNGLSLLGIPTPEKM